MTPVVLIHYHEIALKGKNRPFFEKKLVENLQKATGINKISREFGRIELKLEKESQFSRLKSKIGQVFGVADFSLAYKTEKKMGKIEKIVLQSISSSGRSASGGKGKSFSSFRVTAKRGDKQFPLNSEAINRKIGESVVKKTGKKVSLEHFDLEIFIEIGQKNAYVYLEKIKGPGGLPVGTAGKLLCLLSGGIDSPVAAYRMIKRGAEVDFVHFHSYPQTDQASIEKTKEIVKLLSPYQFRARIFLVPFLKLQKAFFKKCEGRFLVLLYRRAMFRLATTIADREGYLGLITGESLGQVASQTLPNMKVTSLASPLPIYRPLVGDDKQEIIKMAKTIGSFSISIQPHQDCCSLFVPKHPITRAKIANLVKEEAKVNLKKIDQELLGQTQSLRISN